MFKLRAWTFCNERHEVLLYLQSSTGINSERNSRKKRARKKRKAVPLEAKQEVKQAHSNQRTWPCSSSSLILCHFWTRKRFPLIVDSASLTGQVFQYIVSGSIRAKSPVHGFRDYVRLKQSNLKKKKRTKNIYRRKGNKPKPTSRLQLLCAIWMYRKCMRLWVLEELGLLFHVVAFPQGKPVKLLDLHSKDVKERFRC